MHSVGAVIQNLKSGHFHGWAVAVYCSSFSVTGPQRQTNYNAVLLLSYTAMEVKHIKHILCIFFLNVLRSIISLSMKDALQFF